MSSFLKAALSPGGSVGKVSASGTTMEEFCYTLEQSPDRLVVDETHLKGRFDLRLEGQAGSTDEFLQMIRAQSGLILTPDTRNVTMLVVSQI